MVFPVVVEEVDVEGGGGGGGVGMRIGTCVITVGQLVESDAAPLFPR